MRWRANRHPNVSIIFLGEPGNAVGALRLHVLYDLSLPSHLVGPGRSQFIAVADPATAIVCQTADLPSGLDNGSDEGQDFSDRLYPRGTQIYLLRDCSVCATLKARLATTVAFQLFSSF